MKIDELNKQMIKYYNYLIDWIKHDIVIIIICCLTLSVCAFTIASSVAYQDTINDAWFDQWDSVCNNNPTDYVPVPVNITYRIMGDYE